LKRGGILSRAPIYRCFKAIFAAIRAIRVLSYVRLIATEAHMDLGRSHGFSLIGCVAGFIFGLSAMSPAQAGMLIRLSRTNLHTGQVDSHIELLGDDRGFLMRQVDEDDQHIGSLYTGGRFFELDYSKRTYDIVDPQMIREAKATPVPAATLREKLLAEIPPERRAATEQLFWAPPGGPIDWQHRDIQIHPEVQRRRVLGHDCRCYGVLVDGKREREFCVMQIEENGDLAHFMRLSRDASTLVVNLYTTLEMPWMVEAGRREWSHVYDVSGFPLVSRSYEDGEPDEEFRVLSIEQQELPSDVFEVPKGFR
jgi:hypothetical protein